MKKVLVLTVAVILGLTTTMSAKSVAGIDANASIELKQEIANKVEYPAFAKENLVEGTVWLQVQVNDNSKLEVVYWSATNVELGRDVNAQLKDYIVANKDLEKGKTHDMKFKFELNKTE